MTLLNTVLALRLPHSALLEEVGVVAHLAHRLLSTADNLVDHRRVVQVVTSRGVTSASTGSGKSTGVVSTSDAAGVVGSSNAGAVGASETSAVGPSNTSAVGPSETRAVGPSNTRSVRSPNLRIPRRITLPHSVASMHPRIRDVLRRLRLIDVRAVLVDLRRTVHAGVSGGFGGGGLVGLWDTAVDGASVGRVGAAGQGVGGAGGGGVGTAGERVSVGGECVAVSASGADGGVVGVVERHYVCVVSVW